MNGRHLTAVADRIEYAVLCVYVVLVAIPLYFIMILGITKPGEE